MWTIHKKTEIIQKFKEKRDTKYIYRNELDKACFQYDMAYGDFKDLAKRTASDNYVAWRDSDVWRDKAFNIAKNPKYNGYLRSLASKVLLLPSYFFFLIK